MAHPVVLSSMYTCRSCVYVFNRHPASTKNSARGTPRTRASAGSPRSGSGPSRRAKTPPSACSPGSGRGTRMSPMRGSSARTVLPARAVSRGGASLRPLNRHDRSSQRPLLRLARARRAPRRRCQSRPRAGRSRRCPATPPRRAFTSGRWPSLAPPPDPSAPGCERLPPRAARRGRARRGPLPRPGRRRRRARRCATIAPGRAATCSSTRGSPTPTCSCAREGSRALAANHGAREDRRGAREQDPERRREMPLPGDTWNRARLDAVAAQAPPGSTAKGRRGARWIAGRLLEATPFRHLQCAVIRAVARMQSRAARRAASRASPQSRPPPPARPRASPPQSPPPGRASARRARARG